MKSTRQGSEDGELLYSKYAGCKAKRQRVQWDPQRVQLHPLHPPGYGPGHRSGHHDTDQIRQVTAQVGI